MYRSFLFCLAERHRNERLRSLHSTAGGCNAADCVAGRILGCSRGFTLLELLVVIAIIGLLAGYVAPRYFAQIGKSEVAVAKAQLDALEKALDQYRLDTGRYPTTEQGLAALAQRPANEPKWSGPYLKKGVPLDPWDRPYSYKQPGDQGEYDLFSLGKDGAPGGTGEAADIIN
jgi:general secretion pathway protein G